MRVRAIFKHSENLSDCSILVLQQTQIKMFGVEVWIFAINNSFVYTCIKIMTIEQKTEATFLISRLNLLLRRSLNMFRTANG